MDLLETGAMVSAQNAADVTREVTHNLEPLLSLTALLLFRALHEVSVEVSAERGYHPKTSQVSFFAPVEAVALALGVHRCTVYRALPELRALGLIDARAHYTTHRGRTVADGTVWAVRMTPLKGCKARVGYGDLKRQYRNLSGDVEAGRTVWAAMQQSNSQDKKAGIDLKQILRWALPPQNLENPVTVDCRTAPRRDLEAVLDVPYAGREARSAAVTLAAEALAAALRDRGGVNFYRRLLWQLLRRSDSGGGELWHVVYEQAQRAAVDSAEGFARRPGALFVSRLKAAPWWSEVWAAPPVRVGVRLEA